MKFRYSKANHISPQWAGGKSLYAYGFILYAATSIPLQGFSNWLVYNRRRLFVETRKLVMKRLSNIGHYLLPAKNGQSSETLSSSNPKVDVEIEAAVEVR